MKASWSTNKFFLDSPTSQVDLFNLYGMGLQVGYHYPFLTQTTSYRTGDEGWQIANVWQAIYDALPVNRLRQELSDFYTLKHNNIFGNTNRFTLSDGSSIPAMHFLTEGDIIYDNFLGLQFIRLNITQNTWDNAIDLTRAFDDGSWYPLPVLITSLLIDTESSSNKLNDLMPLSQVFWTATTRKGLNTQAFRSFFTAGYVFDPRNKTENQGIQIAYKLIP